jgi:putative serine protease PepD
MPTTLPPPPTEPEREAPSRHTHRPASGRTPRRRASLAMLLATSALFGSATTAGVLVATDAFDANGTSTTTVVQRSTSGSGALDAGGLYDSASPGVVDITVRGGSAEPAVSPFGGGAQPQATASGTGFVIDQEGHIVTASHVVADASTITVKLQDGTTREAELLGQDDATDVAVLKIDPAGLTLHPLGLGSSASLGVGDEIAAIGDPFGYERSISTGIVSGIDRTIEAPNGFTVAHAIQTDAAMNPGNSGGPVLDANGDVVGIADQIATGSGAQQSSGVGFAVPIDLVKSSLETLKAGGTVRHAYLGIGTGNGTTEVAGAPVGTVTPDGPADRAGLQAGDVITKLGGAQVQDSNDLVAAIAEHKPGDEVAVTVQRGGRTAELTVTLGTQPSSA